MKTSTTPKPRQTTVSRIEVNGLINPCAVLRSPAEISSVSRIEVNGLIALSSIGVTDGLDELDEGGLLLLGYRLVAHQFVKPGAAFSRHDRADQACLLPALRTDTAHIH